MTTESPSAGIAPPSQLAAVLHRPSPLVFVQVPVNVRPVIVVVSVASLIVPEATALTFELLRVSV